MPVIVAQIGTAEGADVAIGGAGDLLVAGDVFERAYLWEDFDDETPADFSGLTPIAEIVDSAGTPIAAGLGVVTPSPGDTTGTFLIVFPSTATGAAGVAGIGGLKWRLQLDQGAATQKTLVCAEFLATVC